MKWPKQIVLLYMAACVALVLGGCTASPASTASPPPGAAGSLPGEAVPLIADVNHLPTRFSSHVPYNSVPPTSGPHVAQTVAPGVYREEIPEEIQVHVLEHGHILVQYAPALPAEQVRKLETIARKYSRDVVVAPYSKLAAGIALTAWGRVMRLDQVEPGRVQDFIEALCGRYEHGWKR